MLEFSVLILPYNKNDFSKIASDALGVIKKGGVIAYPTESFYALGVQAFNEEALKKLYEIKNRPSDKPLPVIVGDMDTLLSIVKSVPDQAKDLMERFWPGPLTLLFNALDEVPSLLTGGTGKVAIRIPGESAALYLARALKMPITATSANPSGERPAEDIDGIVGYFSNAVDLAIDSGRTLGGKPSTILDVTVFPPEILREGRIAL